MALCVCVLTCWSSVSEEPGPCWGWASQEDVGVGEHGSVCVSAYWWEGWRNPRSPGRGSSRSRWLRSRCGSDSGACPSPRLSILGAERQRETEIQMSHTLPSACLTHYTHVSSVSVPLEITMK